MPARKMREHSSSRSAVRLTPLFIICIAIVTQSVSAYSSGYYDCVDSLLDPHATALLTGPPPFRISLDLGLNVSAPMGGHYVAGAPHTVKITALNAPFLGFILGGFTGTAATTNFSTGNMTGAGLLVPADDDSSITQIMDPDACPGITHVDASQKSRVIAYWDAPPSGAGPLVFMALVVVDYSTAYMVALDVVEAASPTATPSPSPTSSLTGSVTGTAAATISEGASPSTTPSRTSSAAATPSRSATASPSNTASVSITQSPTPPPPTPSPTGAGSGGTTGPGYLPSSAYRYSVAFDPNLAMFWNVRLADGAIDYRLEVVGQNWLSVAPAVVGSGSTMLDGGMCIIGTLAPSRVVVSYVRSYALSEITFDDGALASLSAYGVRYDSNTGKTIMWWSKGISAAAVSAGNDVDLTSLLAVQSSWIWAYGDTPQFAMHPAAAATSLVLYPDGCTRNATCSGVGSCTPTGACVCDVGYAGASCGGCAALYAAAVGGGGGGAPACVLLDHVLADGEEGVVCVLC